MPTWHFYGQLLPKSYSLSIDLPRNFVCDQSASLGLRMEFETSIIKSNIHVTCVTNRALQSDLTPIRVMATEIVGSYVGLISFKSGRFFSFDLNEVMLPDDTTKKPIEIYNPELASIVSSYDLSSLYEVENIVLSDVYIMRIINDLLYGHLSPHQSVICCARAIDGIKNHMSSAVNVAARWHRLHKNLNVDETYVKLITDASTVPRHGGLTIISSAKEAEITRRTWTIMDRFLHFKKGRDSPLVPPNHPLLIG